MKKRRIFTTRRISYFIATLLVLAVNANAWVEPVVAQVDYILSNRYSVIIKDGKWETAKHNSPVNSIHAALLNTGKVLLIAGSGNNEKRFEQQSFRSVIWDPATGEFKDIPTPWDAFCAGHIFLPDGKLLVAGGTKGYEDLEQTPKLEFQGLKDSYIFDPGTERYEKVDDMNFARWYPTLVGLADGSVLASSGLDEHGNILWGQTEIYDPTTKDWVDRPDLNRPFPTYPALLLTNDGRLFYSGSNAGYGSTEVGRTPGFWDLSNNTFQDVPGLEEADLMETSATVMLPPAQDQRVMVLGGGGVGDSPVASDRTAIVDLDEANPSFVSGPDLKEATRYPNVVILPDDTVLQTGGSRGYRKDDVLVTQIFNPKTNEFREVASPRVGRNYHSEALLLPDGRVATFGSDTLGGRFEMRIEVYSPAYMFRDSRPTVKIENKEITQGGSFHFDTSTPANIATAKLIRPSSVTHVTDVEQRSITLDFVPNETGITATIPENPNLVPAGWYMMFVTDQQGTPSVAEWVHVQ